MLLPDPWTGRIIGAALRVHQALGPGLLESAYRNALAEAMAADGLPFFREVAIPATFEGARLGPGYRADFIVAQSVVVEAKAVRAIDPVHTRQVLAYMRFAHLRLGLILNLNRRLLKEGIKRLIL